MKKLISLLLAVSVMAMSSTTFAAYLGAQGQRNPGANDLTIQGGVNSNVLRDYQNVKHMAVYRPGDTLTFTKGDQTIAEGDVITFISSKVDAASLDSSTVMFIDQVTADSTSPSYSYKIREGLAEGVYKMDIKIGDIAVDTYYYSVGDPKLQIATIDEAGEQQAYVVGDTAYYFGAVSIGTPDVMLEQAGIAEIGFDFGGAQATIGVKAFEDARAAQEIEGTGNWFFSIAVTDVTDNVPTATALEVADTQQ